MSITYNACCLGGCAALLKGDGLGSSTGKPKFLLVLYGGDKSGAQIQESLGTDIPVSTLLNPHCAIYYHVIRMAEICAAFLTGRC